MSARAVDSRADVVLPGFIASVGVAATDAFYLTLIVSEGNNAGDLSVVAFVGGALAATAVLFAVGALLRDHRVGAVLLSLGTGTCLTLGVIGLFSIGIFLLLSGAAGLFATVAALLRGGRVVPTVITGVAGIALALAGFAAVRF